MRVNDEDDYETLTLTLLSTDQFISSSTLRDVVFSSVYSFLKPVPADRTQPGSGTSSEMLAFASLT